MLIFLKAVMKKKKFLAGEEQIFKTLKRHSYGNICVTSGQERIFLN